jgi:hypothetical protein
VSQREAARILRNWKDERDSATLYAALASIERTPRLVRVFNKLADSEHEHSVYWDDGCASRGRPSQISGPLCARAFSYGSRDDSEWLL